MSTRSQLILQKLLNSLTSQNAQELHLTPGSAPRLRQFGELKTLAEEETLSEEFMLSLTKELLSEEQWNDLEEKRETIFTREISSLGRFRVRVYYQKGVISLNLRHIFSQVPNLADLSLPTGVSGLQRLHKGLVIISGPYDSGRSLLAATLLKTIVAERSVRAMTLEQPLEYVLSSEKGAIEQREVGKDVPDMESGLRILIEEDVDVVFVSKIPNAESARLILQLTLAGKLIFALTTSDSTSRALDQLLQKFGQDESKQRAGELADALEAVINLRLVRQAGGTGRIFAIELLLSNLSVKLAIRDRDFRRLQTILQTSKQEGMQTMDQHLLELVNSSKVSADSALKAAHDPSWLGEQLGK